MSTPSHVQPLLVDMGTVAGQRLVLLSLEAYDDWADLRFARTDVGADRPLARRVPAVDAWSVTVTDGLPVEVVDCVGRGDRGFSNGEARLVPPPTPGCQLELEVALVPGEPPLRASVDVAPDARPTS